MQVNRMFEIIYILMNRKMITARELAERFMVSVRTIYRDIETLSAAGIPVYMSRGKGGGISILDGFVLNKSVLTEEEKTEILSSLAAVNAINFDEKNSALKKLSNLFGESNSEWIEVDFSSWYNANNEIRIFKDLKSSILSKQVVSFTYVNRKGESTMREVEPLKLCFKGISRYLYGFCRIRQDFRFFKLSRLKELSILEEHFDRKMSQPIFNSDSYFSDDYISLKLKLSPQMAFRVYDEFDHYIQESDGSFIADIVYPAGEWVFPYIASFGHYCEVLEPAKIRDGVISELKKTIHNYL